MVFLAGIQVAKSQMVVRPGLWANNIFILVLVYILYCAFFKVPRGMGKSAPHKTHGECPFLGEHTHLTRDEDIYMQLSQDPLQPVSSFSFRAESRRR